MERLSTYTIVQHCVKNQIIRLRTLNEEAFGAIAVRPKFATFRDVSNATLCFAACSVK